MAVLFLCCESLKIDKKYVESDKTKVLKCKARHSRIKKEGVLSTIELVLEAIVGSLIFNYSDTIYFASTLL